MAKDASVWKGRVRWISSSLAIISLAPAKSCRT